MNKTMIASEILRCAKMLVGWGKPMPRSFHIPKDAQPTKDVGGTDLEIWTYEGVNPRGPYFGGIAFAGKAQKPLWHYTFQSEDKRSDYIKKTIDQRKMIMDVKNKEREERRNFKHSLNVGDILYDTWGYDQTNVDFYQVVAVGEKSVKIRPISSRNTDDSHVVPLPDKFTGPAELKVVGRGNHVRVHSGAAGPWEGRPVYETPFGMGH